MNKQQLAVTSLIARRDGKDFLVPVNYDDRSGDVLSRSIFVSPSAIRGLWKIRGRGQQLVRMRYRPLPFQADRHMVYNEAFEHGEQFPDYAEVIDFFRAFPDEMNAPELEEVVAISPDQLSSQSTMCIETCFGKL